MWITLLGTSKKGNRFRGIMSGESYDRITARIGLNDGFFRKAVDVIPLPGGTRVLDLGCGTGTLGIFMAEKVGGEGQIDCIDISSEQLSYAEEKTKNALAPFAFYQCSMDDTPFDDERYDTIVSCMSFHEATSSTRRGAIREVARLLKPGGVFALLEWGIPKLNPLILPWIPFMLIDSCLDNWTNRYVALCEEQGMELTGDVYLNPLIRCQVFRK